MVDLLKELYGSMVDVHKMRHEIAVDAKQDFTDSPARGAFVGVSAGALPPYPNRSPTQSSPPMDGADGTAPGTAPYCAALIAAFIPMLLIATVLACLRAPHKVPSKTRGGTMSCCSVCIYLLVFYLMILGGVMLGVSIIFNDVCDHMLEGNAASNGRGLIEVYTCACALSLGRKWTPKRSTRGVYRQAGTIVANTPDQSGRLRFKMVQY